MRKERIKDTLIFVGSVFLCVIAASCSKTDNTAFFRQTLQSIDNTIQTGSVQEALRSLQALRGKAGAPEQYLSIAKRELQLKNPVQALQSIQTGIKKHPNNPLLKAAFTHTLLAENRVEEAASVAQMLYGTDYVSIGAEALINADKIKHTYRTPAIFWQEGFKLTGEHVFLENAAILLAHQGNVAQAAALRSRISIEEALHSPYFWSCLAYDIGHFKPVIDDLLYSLAYADMAGLHENNPKAFEYARRHILLAADASVGLGNLEEARGFWKMYTDRYGDAASGVFYNLAMTAPSKEEKAEALIECISKNPGYYPAVAQYIRACTALNAANQHNSPLDEYLQSKDFFSLEMEKALFVSSAFTLSAEQVLDEAIAANKDDVRFLLENFRYHCIQSKNYKQSNGAMWKILEAHSDNPLVKSYARWYFASEGDFNACFGIDKTDNHYEDMFYDGIRCAVQGNSTAALKKFSEAGKEIRYKTPALVARGYVYDARNEPDMAIKCFSHAAELLQNKSDRSNILYEAAQIYAKRNGIPEALSLLNQALQLDRENHRAQVLKKKLIADGSVNHSPSLDTRPPINVDTKVYHGFSDTQNRL